MCKSVHRRLFKTAPDAASGAYDHDVRIAKLQVYDAVLIQLRSASDLRMVIDAVLLMREREGQVSEGGGNGST